MSEETQVEQVAEQATPPSLGIGDLAGVVRIIDACAKRGAFEGSEMESVGALRGKIAAFVAANTKQEEEPAPKEEATTDE